MTLPDRATVQAIGRPQLQAALDRQGVDVLVRRAGQPDTPTRSLLIPVTSTVRDGVKPDAPEITSLPWKVFFRHDELGVTTPGFHVFVPQDGRTLIPTVPTVDVADQGVTLMLLATPLVGRTRVSVLTFPRSGTGLTEDPRSGNKRPALGEPLTVSARLVATTDPRIRETVGADQADQVLIGRWGDLTAPLKRPAGLAWGSRCSFELDGQPGTLTLKLAYPDADLWREAQFGGRFLASWRTI